MDVLKVAACKGGKTPKVEISAQGGGATSGSFLVIHRCGMPAAVSKHLPASFADIYIPCEDASAHI